MNTLKVDTSIIIRKMKPLHGVGNGPLSRGNTNDISKFFKMISPPYSRLHDTNFPEARDVDVHTIFPDFSKDADNPENYDFFMTDKYLKSIIDLGTDIIYRLGETIATNDKRIHVKPPSDFVKYGKICVNIIRHYNDGWADGFHYNIKYWEIWNEPSVINMWTGTIDQWLEFYKTVYLAIKTYNSEILIGGPVACEPNSPIQYPFLDYVTKNNIIPDFYSFHSYTSSRKHAHFYLDSMYKKLEEYNLTHLPAHITEWNYVPDGDDGRVFWDIPRPEKASLFSRMISEEGAAHVALFMAMLQDSFVEQANYYCVGTDSLFSCFSKIGLPEKPFYSLLAYRKLYDLGSQVELTGNESLDEAYAVAACDSKRAAIMISNLKCVEPRFNISFSNKNIKNYSLKRIDKNHNLETCMDFIVNSKNIEIEIPVHSVALLEFDI